MNSTTIFKVLTIFGVVFCGYTQAQTPAKAKTYTLEVTFMPQQKMMHGVAEVQLQKTSNKQAVFYLHGELQVDSIFAQNKPLKFKEASVFYDYSYNFIAKKITLEDLTTDRLKIYYSGYFNASKARSPSDYMRIEANQVLLRGYGYSMWFPMFLADQQDSYPVDFDKVTIKTPQDLVPVFIGKKLKEYVQGNWKVSEWQAKNTDLQGVQCTARPFQLLKEGPYHIYHLGKEVDLNNAQGILKFLKKLTDRYQKYYTSGTATAAEDFFVMQMPQFGDISSGNVSGLSPNVWKNFNQYTWPKRVLAHELIHPFVHYPMSQSNPMYALMIEGFPSYFHLPVLAELLGENWYQKRMKRIEKSYLYKKKHGKTRRGWKIPAEKPILKITAQEIGDYKDMFILDDRLVLFFNFLRQQMGPQKFYKFAQAIIQTRPGNDQQFVQLIGQFLPQQKQLIKTWLYTNDYPDQLRLSK